MGPTRPQTTAKPSESKKRKEPSQSNSDSKKQGNDNSRPSGRALKRVKLHDAREIDTQPADAALKNGELDLQAFIKSRKFEIEALEKSMRKSKSTTTTRAFQQVPPSMRRRTASHNVKRVPKRLRDRARKEMVEDNTPTVEARKRRPRTSRGRLRAETAKKLGILAELKRKRKAKEAAEKETATATEGKDIPARQTAHTRAARPKIRRNTLNDPPKPKAKFRKRQINKTWLPTHLWHAKRARMTEPKSPLWRFAIPLTPTEKCYRPTHRASGERGAVVWDMSYMSTIGLYGSGLGVERVFKALGMVQESLWNCQGQKWRSGLRSWTGILSKERKDGRRIIGPATVVWNPEPVPDNAGEANETQSKKPQRQVFVRVHPSCFLELFAELQKLVKMQTPRLFIEDLRFEIGSIEIAGPGSTETLLGILHPYYTTTETRESHAALFQSLIGVTNPASLPANALLAFSIRDPRLRYPPRTADILGNMDDIEQHRLLETLARWPAQDDLKSFALFDRNLRFQASQLPTQKSINRRRSDGPPGQELAVAAADPPIPIILLASRCGAGTQAQGKWTLLAPWKCILPIWYSLVHYPLSTGGNPRFGGLNESRQVAFEQGLPWFPADYPGTDAGAEWERDQRAKREGEWNRRPKAKRIAWESLDLGAGRRGEIGSGFACDFEHLFGMRKPGPASSGAATGDMSAMADPEQMGMQITETAGESKAKKAAKVVTRHPLNQITQLSKGTFKEMMSPSSKVKSPPCSIVSITVTFVSRGVCTTPARIYRLPTRAVLALPSTQAEVPATEPPPSTASGSLTSLPYDLRDQWVGKLHRKAAPGAQLRKDTAKGKIPQPRRMPPGADEDTLKRLLAKSLIETPLPYPSPSGDRNHVDMGGHHPLCPGEGDLIGFVTTGSFSLSEGRAMAIGCVSAEKALETLEAAEGTSDGWLCVVRNAGEGVGWLARWEVA